MFHALFGLSGRMRRRTFWLCQILIVVVAIVGIFSLAWELVAQLADADPQSAEPATLRSAVGFFLLMAVLGWVDLALFVKRLHDAGYTGWIGVALKVTIITLSFTMENVFSGTSAFLPFVPTLVIGLLPGAVGPNRYGADPRNRAPEAVVPTAAAAVAVEGSHSAERPTGETALQAAMDAAVARRQTATSVPMRAPAAPAPTAARAAAKPGFGRRGR